jgi:phage-related holin
MKTTLIISLSLTTIIAFVSSYFWHLTADNLEQYLSIGFVVFADGFFGIWAGIKREGFQTRKAIKVLTTFVFWVIILTVILSIEKGYTGTAWLSETILPPFLVFQLISIFKNASMVGIVNNDLLITLLDKIDKHKGEREI